MTDELRKFDISELKYYFDAQEKDSLDTDGRSRKSREVLTLRDQLLSLPDKEFELAIKTLNHMLRGNPDDSQSKNDEAKRSSDAHELYQASRSS
jgi:hypothetical protein